TGTNSRTRIMHTSRQFGPWRPGLDAAELRARLRSLRAIAGLLAGPRAAAMNAKLREAEHDPEALEPAADELDRLAPLDRRRILASCGALAWRQVRPVLRFTPRELVRRRTPRLSVLCLIGLPMKLDRRMSGRR
ncbi:hypothetical protein, partial [Methylobacterium nigriterrae]|uniref:hypothetical protein n=1 Tax=Methylobacterium nigriterrae TaxID=3127512 RepID=UPI0030132AFC